MAQGGEQGRKEMDANNIVLAVKMDESHWCKCYNGNLDRPDARKYSVNFVRGEEVLKHIVSYYQCSLCAGLIKVEES